MSVLARPESEIVLRLTENPEDGTTPTPSRKDLTREPPAFDPGTWLDRRLLRTGLSARLRHRPALAVRPPGPLARPRRAAPGRPRRPDVVHLRHGPDHPRPPGGPGTRRRAGARGEGRPGRDPRLPQGRHGGPDLPGCPQ